MQSTQNNQYNRFSASPWFDKIKESRIIIFGVGNVGSWISLFLARTGASLIVVDFDNVEDLNIAGQLYGSNQIGKPKVEAIKEVVSYLNIESDITALNTKVEDTEKSKWFSYLQLCDVVVVGFDNLPTRQLVYDKWKKAGKKESLFVDMRSSMEQGNVLTVNKDNTDEEAKYQSSFFPESEAVQQPCSAKATSHCGAFVGSLATSVITNWFTDKGNMRSVPNRIDFYLPILNFDKC